LEGIVALIRRTVLPVVLDAFTAAERLRVLRLVVEGDVLEELDDGVRVALLPRVAVRLEPSLEIVHIHAVHLILSAESLAEPPQNCFVKSMPHRRGSAGNRNPPGENSVLYLTLLKLRCQP